MPQRAVNLVLVVAGVATVALLMVLGFDLARAASRGPQWKRRLVGAGLVLLMAIGFAPDLGRAAAEESKPAASAAPATSDKGLAEAKGWQRILAAWKEAEDIASGKRGDYPFDEKGKKQVLANLNQAKADATDLQKAKLITKPEAGLLLKDLDTLTTGVHATLPTEAKNVTCYAPMPFQPGRDSFNRLSDRLPLLEKLAASKTLHREVAEKVLVSVEADIQTLAKEESLKALAQTAQREKAEKTRDAARAAVLRIRDRVWPPATAGAASENTLYASKGWNRILAAWNEAEEIVSGKRGAYPFDEAGKKQVLANLKQAEADAADLQKAKLITEPEAGLLLKDLGTLTAGVQAKRPTEQMAPCYEPMAIRAGHDSLTRLSDRLPLLEKLVAAETIHPEVVEKVLVSIVADIATLAKEESLKEFAKAEERQKAEKTRDAARAAVLRIQQYIRQWHGTCYYASLPQIKKPDNAQSRARQEALERFAAADTLRPDVLRKAAANARALENET